MILAEINELSTIDATINSLHEKLAELYERRRAIIMPSERPHESSNQSDALILSVNLETLDLSLDDASTLIIPGM